MSISAFVLSVLLVSELALQCRATPALDETTVAGHALVARRAAGEGMVLLKNERSTLPLAKGSDVALFGSFGDYFPGGTGSSKVVPVRTVDIPAGLREAGFRVDIEHDVVSERAMREIYLRGFERAVKEAKPWAVMTAYNGINGYRSGENHGLVTGILRDEWGFDGLVMTDWNTTIQLWREVAAGNDVKMPRDADKCSADGDGASQAHVAFDYDYLPLSTMRQSAKRVLELALKSRRFARERRGRN